jgi:uncharacterized protein YndB with AHSA1/START domain
MTHTLPHLPADSSGTMVETPDSEPIIRISRVFRAPRQLIWRCFTEPPHLARFWGPRGVAIRVTVDLQAGGVWLTEWTYPDRKTFTFSSIYLDIRAPERFVYRDCPVGWAGPIAELPTPRTVTTVSLAGAGPDTEVSVLVQFQTIAERDGDVKRGFATTVATGFNRLADQLLEMGA